MKRIVLGSWNSVLVASIPWPMMWSSRSWMTALLMRLISFMASNMSSCWSSGMKSGHMKKRWVRPAYLVLVQLSDRVVVHEELDFSQIR